MSSKATASSGWSAFRRCLAAVCAVAFLIVTFVHDVHHFAGHASGGYELSQVSGDGNQPHPDKAAHVGGHCHGCVMLAAIDVDAPELARFGHVLVCFVPSSLTGVELPSVVPYPIAAV